MAVLVLVTTLKLMPIMTLVTVQMLLPLLATHYAHATVALRQALQRPTSLS